MQHVVYSLTVRDAIAELENIPRSSTAQDDSLLEVLEAMRGKFKTIVAMLGTAEAYASKDAPPAAAAADLDF